MDSLAGICSTVDGCDDLLEKFANGIFKWIFIANKVLRLDLRLSFLLLPTPHDMTGVIQFAATRVVFIII